MFRKKGKKGVAGSEVTSFESQVEHGEISVVDILCLALKSAQEYKKMIKSGKHKYADDAYIMSGSLFD